MTEQDEWENYFNENKLRLIEIQGKIEKSEEKIDEEIFDIYNITEKDKKTIEKTLSAVLQLKKKK